MSWSIKHKICFSSNQRRVKAILDAFFKNTNDRVEDILTVSTDGFDYVLSSWLTAKYDFKLSVLKYPKISEPL